MDAYYFLVALSPIIVTLVQLCGHKKL